MHGLSCDAYRTHPVMHLLCSIITSHVCVILYRVVLKSKDNVHYLGKGSVSCNTGTNLNSL